MVWEFVLVGLMKKAIFRDGKVAFFRLADSVLLPYA